MLLFNNDGPLSILSHYQLNFYIRVIICFCLTMTADPYWFVVGTDIVIYEGSSISS